MEMHVKARSEGLKRASEGLNRSLEGTFQVLRLGSDSGFKGEA